MPQNHEKPIEIRMHFKQHTSEQEEADLWAQIFSILGIFDDDINNFKNDGRNY